MAEAVGAPTHQLLFHIANAVLLFVLLCRMTGALWRSGLVAALLRLHPLHVESVAWGGGPEGRFIRLRYSNTLWKSRTSIGMRQVHTYFNFADVVTSPHMLWANPFPDSRWISYQPVRFDLSVQKLHISV